MRHFLAIACAALIIGCTFVGSPSDGASSRASAVPSDGVPVEDLQTVSGTAPTCRDVKTGRTLSSFETPAEYEACMCAQGRFEREMARRLCPAPALLETGGESPTGPNRDWIGRLAQ